MRKPFDLEYFKQHPNTKVVTGNGENVTVLTTDAASQYPIVALIHYDGNDIVATFTEHGIRVIDFPEDEIYNLFFDIPEPKKKRVPLTHEDLLERVEQGKTMWIVSEAYTFAKQIIGFNKYHIAVVVLNGSPCLYELKYEECTVYDFTNGDPCWKEVEDAE